MRLGNEDDSYVEDRRGQGGGGRGLGVRMGIGGTLVVLTLSVVFRHNFFNDLSTPAPSSRPSAGGSRSSPRGQERVRSEESLKHVAVGAFNDAQATWPAILRGGGPGYRPAHLVLFWDETRSSC